MKLLPGVLVGTALALLAGREVSSMLFRIDALNQPYSCVQGRALRSDQRLAKRVTWRLRQRLIVLCSRSGGAAAFSISRRLFNHFAAFLIASLFVYKLSLGMEPQPHTSHSSKDPKGQ
jgi:hypothetical protein